MFNRKLNYKLKLSIFFCFRWLFFTQIKPYRISGELLYFSFSIIDCRVHLTNAKNFDAASVVWFYT